MAVNISGGGNLTCLANEKNLFIKQSGKGCCRNCCGCDAAVEFTIATIGNKNVDIMNAKEDSSCIVRLCCPGHHPFTINLNAGATGGKTAVSYHRPMKCLMSPLKCCCYQQLEVTNPATKEAYGIIKEDFWICIPQLSVYNDSKEKEYVIHPPTICGIFPSCCAEGCGCCRFPFYVYDATKTSDKVARICKVYSGAVGELMDAHKFELEFPNVSSPEQKARLVGACFLINELFFRSADIKK